MQPIFWLAALIALVGVGEAATVGLASLWFALGSLAALIVSSLGLWPQYLAVQFGVHLVVVPGPPSPWPSSGPSPANCSSPTSSATNADRALGTDRTGYRGDQQHRRPPGLVNL